jgi:hypothetical protein
MKTLVNRLPPHLLTNILLRIHPQHRCTLAILLTCKLWYEITITTPQFWTNARYFDGAPQALPAFNLFLRRSNSHLIDITITFHNLNSYELSRIARAISLAEGRCRILVDSLRGHLFRVRTLEFTGYPVGIFPLPTPMPHLRNLSLTFLMNSKGILPVMDHLVHTGSPIELLAINSCLANNGFLHIDPYALRKLVLFDIWPRTTGLSFLSMCSRLESLHITLMNANDGDTGRALQLPCLRTLFVYSRTNILRAHFVHLPQLNHLTVICGQTADDRVARLQSKRFGEPLYPQSAWPIMPNLRTLTVDHFDLHDLIPTLASSPLLVGLHLHGNRGFTAILRYLLAMPVRGVSHTASRTADGRILRPLPLLRVIRLWAVQESATTTTNVVSHDNEDQVKCVLPLLLDLVVLRAAFQIELGAIQNEPHAWQGLWDTGDLLLGIKKSSYDAQRRIRVIDEYDRPSGFERERCYLGEPPLPKLIPLI